MGAFDFKSLYEHLGHNVHMATYGRKADGAPHNQRIEGEVANVAIECEDCGCVLLDFDNPNYTGSDNTGKPSPEQSDTEKLEAAKALIAEQVDDLGLWFGPVSAPEDYLQQALRKLHAAIEGKSQVACVIENLFGEEPFNQLLLNDPAYKALTKARAAKMKLVYFLAYGKEDEKEVTLDEYMEGAQANNKAFGSPPDHVPLRFMGHPMSGHIEVKEGETEPTLVGFND